MMTDRELDRVELFARLMNLEFDILQLIEKHNMFTGTFLADVDDIQARIVALEEEIRGW